MNAAQGCAINKHRHIYQRHIERALQKRGLMVQCGIMTISTEQ
jgi:hypothetical protein